MSGFRITVLCVGVFLIASGVYGLIAPQAMAMSVGPSHRLPDTLILSLDPSAVRFVSVASILMGIGIGYFAWGEDQRR
jgi:hypothetical protein